MNESEAQRYLNLAGVIFVALDKDGRVTLINRKGCELLGYTELDLIGQNWFATCVPRSVRRRVEREFGKIMKGNEPQLEYFQNPVLTKRGEEKLIEWRNTVLRDNEGRVTGSLSSGTDITERTDAESALRHSEAQLRAIFDTAVDGIIIIDDRGCIESFNPAAQRLFGYTVEEVRGKNVKVLMPASQRDEHDGYLSAYLNTGERKIIGIGREVSGLRKDGTTFPANLSVSEFFVDAEKKYAGFVQDISARKKAEETLLEGESRIRAILDTTLDAIITIDDSGIIQSANSAVQTLFGYTAEEIVGQNVSILMPSPHREKHDHYVDTYLATGEKKIIGIGREEFGQKKDGTTFPIRLSVNEFFVADKRMFTGLIHDLTRQKSLQQKILQSERLAVIGKMAAKVAHEVRNPLSSISLNAELLEEEICNGQDFDCAEAHTLLSAIIREIDRVSSLTDEYLQFSRLPESELAVGDVNYLVREALNFFETEFEQEGIEIDAAGLDRRLSVPIDSAQLRRVLMNIIRNAVESMDGGGKLKVWTKKNKQLVTLGIQDTGAGIPAAMVANIFNPFFTTKDFGTGLGLAISQQIVQEHKGRIYCESEVGKGTTFMIELPAKEKEEA